MWKKWLFSLICILAFSLIGWAVSLFIDSLILLWVFLGFSIIFSIEKWFTYYTRKWKKLGITYKLILNLAVFSLFGLLVWSAVMLFYQDFLESPLVGSIVFIVEIVVFIWLFRIVLKNGWRKPSMILTAISIIILFLIFAFAGVQPMADYKDSAIDGINNIIDEQKKKAEERAAEERAAEEERISSLGITNTVEFIEELDEDKALRIGIEVVELVNNIRQERGSPLLLWDEELYEYSKAHSEAMASRRDLFHSSMDKPYAENACGGEGSKSWGADTIVESWMTSDKHRTWLLCPRIRHVAVGIAYSSNGMYASWTFWRSEPAQSDWWYQYSPDNPPEWWY